MSKKKKTQQKQENLAQSVAALTANGLKAFRLKDFEKAITTWEKIPVKLRPAAWLAEAHFRLGLALFYGTPFQTGLDHLQTALSYQPDDAGYTYHIGLIKHHQGDIAGALTDYQKTRQTSGPFALRAAYPLALTLLQSGQDPAAESVWTDLTAAEQAMLRSASAFRRRPYNLTADSPLLSHALAAFDAGEKLQAQAGLTQVLASAEATLGEKNLAHLYQGMLAAQAEDLETARREWEAASQAGMESERLHSNLAEIYLRRAEEALSQGDVQTALAAAQESKRHRSEDDSTLNEILAQIHQHLGYQAATANDWNKAKLHWERAVEMDSASFRLAYNLALVYEKLDDALLAAETWREALRRRPRRADHPDALSDEQVARLWQHTAECYAKAGEFEEVGKIYQQAIKWAPDNLNLRMELAESLMRDGRIEAAQNELGRLLERDPKNIPALLRMGESFFSDEYAPSYVKAQAKTYFEKALEIEPKNQQARDALGEWYFDQAEIDYSWDNYLEAIEGYQKSLEFRPRHIQTLVYLAECFIELDNQTKAEEFIQLAQNHATTLEDYDIIIEMWLRAENDIRAWDVMAQAEIKFGKVPVDFYLSMAHQLFVHDRKDQAPRWLEHAVEQAAPEDNILVMIGEMVMDFDAPLAMTYLQKALDAKQAPGQAHMLMGMLEKRQRNDRASKKHLSEAERIARQTKDPELAERIELARTMSDTPRAIMQRILDMGGPNLMEEFIKRFGEDSADDW